MQTECSSTFQVNHPKIYLLVGLFILTFCEPTFAQQYFQQEVNYQIHVSLNDSIHELVAFESIEYINHSPDTLRVLYFHLWPNAYSSNETPLAKQLSKFYGKRKWFDQPEWQGAIDSLNFKIEGITASWETLPGQPDVCRIELNEPLLPEDTLLISTPFRVKIPANSPTRMGHNGKSYQLSQWYPKPAVYDESGWHPISYLDQGEFYSEFGNFEVSITLPSSYVVGASGKIQTETTVSSNQERMKSLQFSAKNAHDFAWFANQHFQVKKGSVKLPNSGRIVDIQALFPAEKDSVWKNAIEQIREAILFYSKEIGDYPYATYTAVQTNLKAGEGMEYPGLSVIGDEDNPYWFEEVLVHEIGHNWFYGALASNERRYPFMDESLTSAYTNRYMKLKYPDKKLWEVYIEKEKVAKFFKIEELPVQQMEDFEWLSQAQQNLEQPIISSSTDFSYNNYTTMLYTKAPDGFNYLRAYLGDSVFSQSIQNYYRQWHFKHPQPADLRSVFEQTTGKSLDWFFDDFLKTTKRLDYKIVKQNGNQVLVKNKGELAAPLVIADLKNDSVMAEKWVEGFQDQQWISLPPGNYSSLKIDPEHLSPEINRMNNNISLTGNFRKSDPVKTQLLFSIKKPEEHTIMYLPTINWTRQDGFMPGIALHNGFILPKPIEYFVMPFYSFKRKSFAGYGKLAYNFTPYNKFVRLGTIRVQGTKFGAPNNQNYYQLETGLDLHFRNKNATSPYHHLFTTEYIVASKLNQLKAGREADLNSYLQFGYQLAKRSALNPFELKTTLELNQAYQKVSFSFSQKLSYEGAKKGLNMKLFAGTMLKEDAANPFYSFAPSGRAGLEEYLFKGHYPDRFAEFPSTFGSKQMQLSEGALASPVNQTLGYSRWLVSLSLDSHLPWVRSDFPIKPFATFLVSDQQQNREQIALYTEAGIKAGIWDFFEVYFPAFVSKNLDQATGSFKNRIRFILNFNSIHLISFKRN